MTDNQVLVKLIPLTYPPALQKACEDPFDYALATKSGDLFYFVEAAVVDENWVHLKGIRSRENNYGLEGDPWGSIVAGFSRDSRLPCFDRGLDLAVSEIVWVADAPHGS